MEDLHIIYIYADGCTDCERAMLMLETMIDEAVDKEKVTCQIHKFKYDSKAAINIAIRHDIDELPAIVIGDKAFKGGNIDEKEIYEALEVTCSNLGNKKKQ